MTVVFGNKMLSVTSGEQFQWGFHGDNRQTAVAERWRLGVGTIFCKSLLLRAAEGGSRNSAELHSGKDFKSGRMRSEKADDGEGGEDRAGGGCFWSEPPENSASLDLSADALLVCRNQ